MHLFLFKITAKTIKKTFMWSQFPSYHSISLFPFTAKLTVKVLPVFTSSLLPDSFLSPYQSRFPIYESMETTLVTIRNTPVFHLSHKYDF